MTAAASSGAAVARFHFFGELNDFLPSGLRHREFSRACARDATVKHMVEALGVPHTEVGRVLVNGAPADPGCRLRDGDRVTVHPGAGWTPLDGPPRFIADAHLGGLARRLRMAGFDTLYDNHLADARIVELALAEGRVILSRDRELLKRREVRLGGYVHAVEPGAQLREVVQRFGLARHARPFSRCLACNAPLRPVAKAAVLERLPPGVRQSQERFSACEVCGRIYWEGSHWRAMAETLAPVLGDAVPVRAKPTR